MTTIDQRILIPASQAVVWAYISDINNNPSWQEDCESVSFLTSKREGPGTRWRSAPPKGREAVVEITAWYNGLGYEYVYVDGPAYRENRGRVRLQEIPEGTIVQWTFSYEIGGMLAGMRSGRRQVENTMAASLKTLYRKIKQYAAEGIGSDAKSLMRDAPNVEARSQYKPRHPSAPKSAETEEERFRPPEAPIIFDEPPVMEDDGQQLPAFAIEEPPITQDDTRPRPAVTSTELETSVPEHEDEIIEPDFLNDYARFEPPRDVEDTPPRATPQIEAEPDAIIPADAEQAEAPEIVAREIQESAASPAYVEIVYEEEPEPASVNEKPEAEEAAPQETRYTAPEPEKTTTEVSSSATQSTTVTELPPTAVSNPASIWEIFGVPRPSETQEARVIVPPVEAEPVSLPSAPVEASSVQPPHHGLRIKLRRRLIRLRRPL